MGQNIYNEYCNLSSIILKNILFFYINLLSLQYKNDLILLKINEK